MAAIDSSISSDEFEAQRRGAQSPRRITSNFTAQAIHAIKEAEAPRIWLATMQRPSETACQPVHQSGANRRGGPRRQLHEDRSN